MPHLAKKYLRWLNTIGMEEGPGTVRRVFPRSPGHCGKELHEKKQPPRDRPCKNGRGEWNRTTDLYVPNVALYQAELHPDTRRIMRPAAAGCPLC